jgi:anti-anti-sigma factor
MAEAQLEFALRREGQTAILDLRGDITAFAQAALQSAYAQVQAARPRTLALNFSQVKYINSTGIALVVSLLAAARKDQLPVVGYGLSDHYREIFEITRLAEYVRLVADEPSALQAAQEEHTP